MALSRHDEMAEKKAMAGSNAGTTYFAKAQSEITLQEQGGRYSTGTLVTGQAPHVQYPRLPSGPWAQGDNPIEPPLGWSVEAQETVGEHFEVEASLKVEATTDHLARGAEVVSHLHDQGATPDSVAPVSGGDGGVARHRPQPTFKRRFT
jgi:hypothetical protein